LRTARTRRNLAPSDGESFACKDSGGFPIFPILSGAAAVDDWHEGVGCLPSSWSPLSRPLGGYAVPLVTKEKG